MAYQGDLIGCAVEFAKFKDGKVPVVFTLNGEVIYEATMKYERGALELYPFIGMGHKDIRVLAKVTVSKTIRSILKASFSRLKEFKVPSGQHFS